MDDIPNPHFTNYYEYNSLFRSCADKNTNLVPFLIQKRSNEREFSKICALEFEVEEIMIIEEEEEMGRRNTLPQEIVMEILSRLSANSLVSTFKFVCKVWRSLIQDPDFIKMHLNRRGGGGGGGGASINGDGETSLMRKPKYGKAIFQLHPRLNCDKPPFIFENLPISVATKLDFDFDILPSNSRMSSSSSRLSWKASFNVDYDFSSSRLVGSWNGLLCLSVNKDASIIILNPTTRKHKRSPRELIECPNEFTFDNVVTYGFGCFHNSTTTIDEYKVVRIAFFNPLNDDNLSCPLQINIYSMSSNSWRTVNDIPPRRNFGHDSLGVFLNGVVHWMGCNQGYFNYPYIWDTIVCFSIRDEVFGQIPMAPCVDVVVHDSNDVILMNWRGYLGMMYCSRTERMDIDLEIWVMKEYGIGESWTKEFVIRTSDSDPLRGELTAGFSIESRSIMTCFWTGDQILIVGNYLLVVVANGYTRYGRWVLYDLNKKKINEDFLMVGIPYERWEQQFDYIDTLVSLKSSLFPLSNNRKRKK